MSVFHMATIYDIAKSDPEKCVIIPENLSFYSALRILILMNVHTGDNVPPQ